MKKTFKSVLALALCFVMLASFAGIGYASGGKKSSCSSGCEFYPTIIVPGLGQSSVCVTDDDGNFVLDKDGNKVTAFPAYIQTDKIIKELLIPAVMSLTLQKDAGFSDAFAKVIDESFGINACDLNAKTGKNVVTEKFLHSYAECTDYEKEIINTHIPFEMYPTDLPADHIYYFAYNSFGNHIDLADELYDFIQMVKKQTGHKKVNLVPLSQGSSIVSAMLEYHPEVMDQLHKVMFVVPALDGSIIIGDVFNGRINFLDSDYLYNGFLEEIRLLDEFTARLIEIAARILPDEVIMAALNKGVKNLVENTMIRSTSMWALCPSFDYKTAAAKYLSSPEMANIKKQTDRYYQAQLHARDNIKKLKSKGVQVFDVAEYNYAVINVGENWNKMNGDFIIHLDSTSMGAYSANCGETLPKGYKQKNTHCSNPAHNHISPDRVVDASAGLLPDTTFYFNGQRHDLTRNNDVILRLAMQLIANDNIKNVYSSPEFPQFLSGRDVRKLLELKEAAAGVKTKWLIPSKRTELEQALAQADEVLSDNLKTSEDFAAAEARLEKILVRVGAIKAEKEKDPSVLRAISLYLYNNFGTDGYSEIPAAVIKKLFDKITGLFG